MPDNRDRVRELSIEPGALHLHDNRFPAEVVLIASIAISLHKIAKELEAKNMK